MKNTSAGGIKGIESLEMNVNSQTNIEVDLDLIEDLYQWFPFIFSDFYLKKQWTTKKAHFKNKKSKIKELKNSFLIKMTIF